ESGPSAASACLAAAGASGVDVTSGFMMRSSSHGSSTMAVSVGTDDAMNHETKLISSQALRASSAPSGLAAIAVNHSADDRLRLTMPENIRKLPRRRRLPSPGLAPAASASEE